MEKYNGQTLGWGPWRKDWYSICSAHRNYDSECHLCAAGHYCNKWKLFLWHIVFKISPKLWQWWANQPNRKSRKFIEEVFPNLRHEDNIQ